jgi:dTDP-4-dehydrorhamnose reductase
MKENILITGGSGLLALNWAITIRNNYNVILGLHNRKIKLKNTQSFFLDLESEDSIIAILKKIKPNIVIHSAGLTNIELCQSQPELAKSININLSNNLSKVCHKLNIPMVYISTDHLFLGDKPKVDEKCTISPVNTYAETKASAEISVIRNHPESLIIRTNFYGWGTSYRKSFSDMVIDNLRNKIKIILFKDIFHTPILIEHLVITVHELIKKKATGIFNVVGDERISKYEFGLMLAKEFNLDRNLIKAGKISDSKLLVLRPHDISLSNKKVSDFLGKQIGGIYEHITKLKSQEMNGQAKELKAL